MVQTKPLIKSIVVASITGIIGITAMLYTQEWNPVWNPFTPNPEIVFAEMMTEMRKLETVRNEINFSMEIKDAKDKFKILINLKTDGNATDSENLKSITEFETIIASNGAQYNLRGETMTIGKDSYLKLTTVPFVPSDYSMLLAIFSIDLLELKNQWIKFDKQGLKQIAGEEYSTETEEKQSLEEKEKADKIFKEIIDLSKNRKFFKIEQKQDEKINNKTTYHYIAILDKEEVKLLFPEITQIIIKHTDESESPIEFFDKEKMESEAQKFSDDVDEFFAKTGDFFADIWIGKKDKLLYKVKFEKEIKEDQFEEVEQGEITIKMDMNFSNFNQPAEINPPENFKTLDEIFGFESATPFFNNSNLIELNPELEYGI
jgi:hypothetical protein